MAVTPELLLHEIYACWPAMMAIGIRSLALSVFALLVACAPSWEKDLGLRASGETFGFRKWMHRHVEPDVVIIGIHGFCGNSLDYRNLGRYLKRYQPKTALYAYEVRGQGSDPIHERRGDIGRAEDWYADLQAFTRLVRDRHPDAKVVWYGESMGALIATHAWCQAPKGIPPCDGLVLSSAIVRFREDIPNWLPAVVRLGSVALPETRITLETLMQGEDVQMTQTHGHSQQAEKNSWHVEDYTLRLMGNLTKLIAGMSDCAERLEGPLLILHGEHDELNQDEDIRAFIRQLPEGASVTYHHYQGAYHLLMYDRLRGEVFEDVAEWVEGLRRAESPNFQDF